MACLGSKAASVAFGVSAAAALLYAAGGSEILRYRFSSKAPSSGYYVDEAGLKWKILAEKDTKAETVDEGLVFSRTVVLSLRAWSGAGLTPGRYRLKLRFSGDAGLLDIAHVDGACKELFRRQLAVDHALDFPIQLTESTLRLVFAPLWGRMVLQELELEPEAAVK